MVKLGMSCIKYFLFGFNAIFVLGGACLIIIGIIVQNKGMTLFGDTTYVSMPFVIIVIGAVTFLTSFFGCCGAVNENIFKLSLFGLLMLILFVCQIGGIVYWFLHREAMDSVIRKNMKDTLKDQKNDTLSAWDMMQAHFHCCGVDSPKDYKEKSVTMPKSCCKKDDQDHCDEGKAFQKGCYNKILEFVYDNLTLVGYVGGIVAGVELLTIIFTFCLISAIREDNQARAPPPHYRY